MMYNTDKTIENLILMLNKDLDLSKVSKKISERIRLITIFIVAQTAKGKILYDFLTNESINFYKVFKKKEAKRAHYILDVIIETSLQE